MRVDIVIIVLASPILNLVERGLLTLCTHGAAGQAADDHPDDQDQEDSNRHAQPHDILPQVALRMAHWQRTLYTPSLMKQSGPAKQLTLQPRG